MKHLLLAALIGASLAPANAQVARVVTLADSLVGGVGGIAVDRLGNVYSADFMDTVWRIRPDGRTDRFATGLYGPSGNFFDPQGNLLQSNFFGNYISKIARDGSHEVWVENGLNGPVGLTLAADGTTYVCNCSSNSIARVTEDRVAKEFAAGDLFRCPNGITTTPDGDIWVVNFSDGNVIRISEDGEARVHATVPGSGNGHITFARGALYVTAFQSHRIYRVSLEGEVDLVAGSANPGEVDGPPEQARFIFPNGIAVAPSGDRMFVNDYINRSPPTLDIPPVPLANVRLIKLANLAETMAKALQEGGVEDMKATHAAWRANPATAGAFTQIQLNVLGYQLMQAGNLEAAVTVFELNVQDYPQAFNPWDSLGEGLMNAGRTQEAIEAYERSLALNPDNQNARDMIARMQGDQ
ncbi:MAG: SMP-30/gluconolactonase/LRE family protein [Rhodothermales bacterium]|nr:SMP-30/gluconolactonase/LRE family protein [Rhodothermales bacterium]MBO6780685.1 SMP-30/gluconolactonase/LRE family protein [Rhodothermales bacterium]